MESVEFEVRLLEKTKALETVCCAKPLVISDTHKMD